MRGAVKTIWARACLLLFMCRYIFIVCTVAGGRVSRHLRADEQHAAMSGMSGGVACAAILAAIEFSIVPRYVEQGKTLMHTKCTHTIYKRARFTGSTDSRGPIAV